MANLTLSINDELLKSARIRALEQDTSVNALVKDYLQDFVMHDKRRSGVQPGMAEFLALTKSIDAGSGSEGRRWTREELYER